MDNLQTFVLTWSETRELSPYQMARLDHYIQSRAIYSKELLMIDQLPAIDRNECLQQIEKCNDAIRQILSLPAASYSHAAKNGHLGCANCGLEYGGDAWIEAVIPDKVWNDIRPEGKPEGAGILCISCIAKRLTQKGYTDVPVWLCGTEPLKVIEGDPSDSIDLLRSEQGDSLKKE